MGVCLILTMQTNLYKQKQIAEYHNVFTTGAANVKLHCTTSALATACSTPGLVWQEIATGITEQLFSSTHPFTLCAPL